MRLANLDRRAAVVLSHRSAVDVAAMAPRLV